LNAAVAALREADMVVGPTLDGGYYLIGFVQTAWPRAEGLFTDIAWSTETVFRATVDKATQAELQINVLPGWYDLDTIDDVRQALLDARPESNLARWGARPEAMHFISAG
jgi:uncharacterized protein